MSLPNFDFRRFSQNSVESPEKSSVSQPNPSYDLAGHFQFRLYDNQDDSKNNGPRVDDEPESEEEPWRPW